MDYTANNYIETKLFTANNTSVYKYYFTDSKEILYRAIWDDGNYCVQSPMFETVSELMGYLYEINESNERDTHETEVFDTIMVDLYKMPYISKGRRVDAAYMLFTEYENDVDPSINRHALQFDTLADFEAAHSYELFN